MMKYFSPNANEARRCYEQAEGDYANTLNESGIYENDPQTQEKFNDCMVAFIKHRYNPAVRELLARIDKEGK